MYSKLPVLAVALVIGAFLIITVGMTMNRAGAAPEAGEKQEGTKIGSEEAVEIATFAGGCFWCMEPPFDKLDGVLRTTSGYTAGEKRNPTYKEVSAGKTGHTEAVQITYDPDKITYAELLEVFWR
ncbi:MAG: peptide-methionine (S)-S-oxide reductase, partial [bacterium]|nr:peptide-methionine (S)-S-oxide reductase [bacterium]